MSHKDTLHSFQKDAIASEGVGREFEIRLLGEEVVLSNEYFHREQTFID